MNNDNNPNPMNRFELVVIGLVCSILLWIITLYIEAIIRDIL